MEIRFLEIAQLELDEAVEYYNSESPGLGEEGGYCEDDEKIRRFNGISQLLRLSLVHTERLLASRNSSGKWLGCGLYASLVCPSYAWFVSERGQIESKFVVKE